MLLNYWVYDKLTNIFVDKEKTNIAFGNFQTLFRKNIENPRSKSRNKNCTHKFDILNKEDWDKRKELYDYYIDYDTNKSTFNIYGEKCEEYYKYVQGKKELYEYFEGLCKSKENECPDFYEECKNYNPHLVLRNFPCHVQIEAAKNRLSTQDTSDQGLVDGPRPYGSNLSGHSAHSSEFTPLGQWIHKLGGSNHNITDNGFGDEVQESGNLLFDGGENYISYQPM
ncbi:PIR Superfamily Protein [Plasmodium ovale wallikeri]|uniref:PIR Superfamily Protein n=1 Tax=Plasmodium ovale wallikeri TaxID=864142 RepID=A0A1A9AQK6_PLAOA|nr:PIR Superfamily Protein [Plasmodium ovale wallikeri]